MLVVEHDVAVHLQQGQACVMHVECQELSGVFATLQQHCATGSIGPCVVCRYHVFLRIAHAMSRHLVYTLLLLVSRLQVKIMKDFDPTGRNGPKIPLPDVVKVHEPKDDELVADKPYVGKELEA